MRRLTVIPSMQDAIERPKLVCELISRVLSFRCWQMQPQIVVAGDVDGLDAVRGKNRLESLRIARMSDPSLSCLCRTKMYILQPVLRQHARIQ
jgi:hypothetical protein